MLRLIFFYFGRDLKYLGLQNQWKINQKMNLKSDWILHWFLIDFLLIFEATWLQDNMADIAKTLKKQWFFLFLLYRQDELSVWLHCLWSWIFNRFFIDFGSQKLSKINKKSIRKVIKKMIGFNIEFLLILGGFWEGLGSQVGPKIH